MGRPWSEDDDDTCGRFQAHQPPGAVGPEKRGAQRRCRGRPRVQPAGGGGGVHGHAGPCCRERREAGFGAGDAGRRGFRLRQVPPAGLPRDPGAGAELRLQQGGGQQGDSAVRHGQDVPGRRREWQGPRGDRADGGGDHPEAGLQLPELLGLLRLGQPGGQRAAPDIAGNADGPREGQRPRAPERDKQVLVGETASSSRA